MVIMCNGFHIVIERWCMKQLRLKVIICKHPGGSVVKWLTLDCSSGYDLRVVGSNPESGSDSVQGLPESLSFSPSVPLPTHAPDK